jgi:hypothetical protein
MCFYICKKYKIELGRDINASINKYNMGFLKLNNSYDILI